MDYRVFPSPVKGKVEIPSSKSHTLRAILLASMAKGNSRVRNFLSSPDTQAMIAACRLLGARIAVTPKELLIEGIAGNIGLIDNVIDAGNSGQVLRFVAAMAALSEQYVVLTGDASLRHIRPMEPLLEGLRQLGAEAVSTRGNSYAPVLIKGPIHPGKARIHGEDSQPVSALLFATALLPGRTEIEVVHPGETSWVTLTLSWLTRLGVNYEQKGFNWYAIEGKRDWEGFTYPVPGDWSSAAYPLIAALITQSEITLTNLDWEDVQGDKKVLSVLKAMGIFLDIDKENKKIHLPNHSSRGQKPKGIRIDINACIDALPLLAVLACFADGKTEIVNGKSARYKECDRIFAIAKELRKMGAQIEEREDGLEITPSLLQGADCLSYQDHRMAMALTVAALGAQGSSYIRDVDCIAKSYPFFYEEFCRMGADIERL